MNNNDAPSLTPTMLSAHRLIGMLLRRNLLSRIVNISEFQVHFDLKIFLKFMVYHFMFFYFGFLTIIPVFLIDSFQAVNNMSFWISTGNKTSFFVQVI